MQTKIRTQKIFKIEDEKQYKHKYTEILTTQIKELLSILNICDDVDAILDNKKTIKKIEFDLKQIKNILNNYTNKLDSKNVEHIGLNLFPETMLYLYGKIKIDGIKNEITLYDLIELNNKLDNKLTIEILESGNKVFSITDNYNTKKFKEIFIELKKNKIKIFIDDLGEGTHKFHLLYDILGCYCNFVNGIKIDINTTRLIIKEGLTEKLKNDFYFKKVLLMLKQHPHIKIVFEGVETEEELLKIIEEIKKELNIEYKRKKFMIQGFVFDKGKII